MKKQFLLYYSFILVLFMGSCRLLAQNPDNTSATGHVSAEVIAAYSAVETSQMNFGRFSPGPSGGQLILTPQGTISVIGSIVQGGGIHNAASFYVTGDAFSAFSITLPKSPVTLTNVSNAKTLRISNWVSVPSPGPGGGTLKDGFQTVFLGATLEVGTIIDNPVGVYTGTYTVTFEFN